MPFPFVPLILGGLSALSGVLSNRGQKAQQDQQRTTNTTQSGTSSVIDNPLLPGDAGGLRASLINNFLNQANNPAQIDPNLINQQELIARQQAERNADSLRERLIANITGRGLSSSAANPLALGLSEMFRGQGISDVAGQFANTRLQLPGLNQSLALQPLQAGASFLSSLPVGRTLNETFNRTGSETSIGDTSATTGGNKLGGLFSGIADTIGLFAGLGGDSDGFSGGNPKAVSVDKFGNVIR